MSISVYVRAARGRIDLFRRNFDGVETYHSVVSSLESRAEAQRLLTDLSRLIDEVFPPKKQPMWQYEV